MRAKRTCLCLALICSFWIAGTAFGEVAVTILAESDLSAQPHAVDTLKGRLRDARAGDFVSLEAADRTTLPKMAGERAYLLDHSAELFKVLSFIEKRVKDRKLITKIKDKLPTLDEPRLRIIVSLSDYIADESGGVKTEIAFLLLTTLIVFS